jgi:hypothetical protein
MPAVASDASGRVTAIWLAETAQAQSVESAVLLAMDPDKPYWEPAHPVYAPDRGDVLSLAVAAGPGAAVMAAWSESRAAGARVYAAELHDGVLAAARLDGTHALVDGRDPAVVLDGLSEAHVAWRGTTTDGNVDPYAVHATLQRPAYQSYAGKGWLQYVPREPNCGTDGYVVVTCDGTPGPFMWPTTSGLPALLGSYVSVHGSLVSEGNCPHAEPSATVLETSPCPRGTGSITGIVTIDGSPVEAAAVSAAGQTVFTGPSGRFFLDRVPAGTTTVTATARCALVSADNAAVVPRGFLATLQPAGLVLGDVVRDGVVDVRDLVRVGAAHKTAPPFLPECVDLDRDGVVTIADMAIVGDHLDQASPAPWTGPAKGPGETPGGGSAPGTRSPAPMRPGMVAWLPVARR